MAGIQCSCKLGGRRCCDELLGDRVGFTHDCNLADLRTCTLSTKYFWSAVVASFSTPKSGRLSLYRPPFAIRHFESFLARFSGHPATNGSIEVEAYSWLTRRRGTAFEFGGRSLMFSESELFSRSEVSEMSSGNLRMSLDKTYLLEYLFNEMSSTLSAI